MPSNNPQNVIQGMKISRLLHKIVDAPIAYFLRPYHYFPIDDTQKDDIFVVGFPKSGNTWLQSICAGLQFGIDTQYLPDKLVQELCPDVYYKRFYKRFHNFTFFKSHDLPKSQHQKVIYIVRDGRDAMLSYWHMNKNLGLHVSLENMIKQAQQVFPTTWWQHTQAWIENPFEAQILYIRYEDLLQNPENILTQICQFANLERNQEQILRVISGTSLAKMQQKEQSFGMDAWKGDEKRTFFRKGKKDAFRNEMPQELQDFFWQKASTQLLHFGYEK